MNRARDLLEVVEAAQDLERALDVDELPKRTRPAVLALRVALEGLKLS